MQSYLEKGQKEIIANELAGFFHRNNMVSFAKLSADLYKDYGEFTADEIMRMTKKKFLLMHLNG